MYILKATIHKKQKKNYLDSEIIVIFNNSIKKRIYKDK